VISLIGFTVRSFQKGSGSHTAKFVANVCFDSRYSGVKFVCIFFGGPFFKGLVYIAPVETIFYEIYTMPAETGNEYNEPPRHKTALNCFA
jgi:hypothetical protein